MAAGEREQESGVPEFRAVVTDIQMVSRAGTTARWRMALDPTGFVAGDVGTLHAVARSGTPIEVPVLAVVADGCGGLWHLVEKPLAAGTGVVGRVSR